MTHISRRQFLYSSGLASLSMALYKPAFGATTTVATPTGNPILVFVALRGAADALHIMPPVGDPAYAPLKTDVGTQNFIGWNAKDLLPLVANGITDPIFMLHPRLPNLQKLYAQKDALAVFATAPGLMPVSNSTSIYTRSHFDAQDLLDLGLSTKSSRVGWLNRLIGTSNAVHPAPASAGLAISNSMPLSLLGPAPVTNWSADRLNLTIADNVWNDYDQAFLNMYERNDELKAAYVKGMSNEVSTFVKSQKSTTGRETAAQSAVRLLSKPNGLNIAVIEITGWDSHVNILTNSSTNSALNVLNETLGTLSEGLKNYWKDTMIVVATEFGRTLKPNGAKGTDHGTGAFGLVIGGAISGGRVIGSSMYPGLNSMGFDAGRDLKPLHDFRSFIRVPLQEMYKLSDANIATVLPGMTDAPPFNVMK